MSTTPPEVSLETHCPHKDCVHLGCLETAFVQHAQKAHKAKPKHMFICDMGRETEAFSKLYFNVSNRFIICISGRRIQWILCYSKSSHMSGTLYFTKISPICETLKDRTEAGR
jgi:hypothetical protein